MRNYPFPFYVPAYLQDKDKSFPIPDIATALETLGDLASISQFGLPTSSETSINANVYIPVSEQLIVADEFIFKGAALNLFYRDSTLYARLATNALPDMYCNAVSFSNTQKGELTSVKIGTAFISNTSHPVVSNSPVWLSSVFGIFTSTQPDSIGQIVQLCGYTLYNNSIYFQYNQPVLTS
jgi:hypothetical protein